MLRESVNTHDQEVDLNVLLKGGQNDNQSADIEFQHELIRFAEAVVGNDAKELAGARDELVRVAGTAVMVDAAGVASNFQRMVRIADSTGIELGDEAVTQQTEELRNSLGINDFKKT